jgi:HK97 family phage portal protein
MGLLDRIDQTISRGVDPVTMEEFGYLLGQDRGTSVRTRSGVTMGPKKALGITAWYSGVRYISETMAGLPCKVYRDSPAGREQRADPPWKQSPDIEQVWFGLVESWLMALLHKGNAYSFKLRSPSNEVIGLRSIHPDRIRPGVTPSGFKVFELDGRHDIAFTTREILHIPGLSYDGCIGLNPIQTLADPLGSVAAADHYASSFFGSSSRPDAYISTPNTLTNEQAIGMQQLWLSMHRGLMNSHDLAVMGGGAEYKLLGLNPEQTQLIESRKYGVPEVSRMLRLPPHKLYDLERATFSNIEQQSIEAVVDGIRPWCTRIEAWVNADPDLVAPGAFIEFELEGLLRGDAAARAAFYQSGIAGGWMMPSEPRALENLPHIEGSDFLTSPLNMRQYGPDAVVVDDASARAAAELLQKGYLAVTAGVITPDELRDMANQAGAELPVPMPRGAPA